MSTHTPKRLAHVAASSQSHNGDLLIAIQVEQIGNCLDNDSLSISVAIDLASKFANHIYAPAVR